MNFLQYILFYLLSIELNTSPVFILLSFYFISFWNVQNFKFNFLSLFDISIISILVAFLVSFSVALINGNTFSYILNYSGGLLILPLYFFLKSYLKYKHNYYLKIILRVFLFISIISVIYLLSASFTGPFSWITDSISPFLGGGQRSGYMDTRYYALSVLVANFPTSILLIFYPKEYLNIIYPGLIKDLTDFTFIKTFGVIILITGLLLFFSSSTLIIIFLISIPIIYKFLRFTLNFSYRIPKKHLKFGLILFSFLLFISFLFVILAKNIDFDNIIKLLDFKSQVDGTKNDPRIDQIKYIFEYGNFSFFGRGLGASFEGTNLIRSYEAPYGIEVSYINLLDKFGFFTILFIPYLINLIKQYSYCFLNVKNSSIIIYRISFLLSNTYLILAIGNPIIFSLQLNFISLFLLALLSAKIDSNNNRIILKE